jgi:drug/metabolite transporter (DMT)-like permease
MGPKQWICFGMSTLGLVLITGIGDISGGTSNMTGIAFGLGAAVLYATVILLNKFIRGVAGIQRTFYQFMAAIAVLVPYVLCTSGVNLGSLTGAGWINLLVVGLFHTGITYCMYFSALKELPGQKAAILSYIDPLMAVLLSVFLLGEKMTFAQLLGGAFILGFTLWNELDGTGK